MSVSPRIRRLAALAPVTPAAPDALRDALGDTGLSVSPDEYAAAALTAGALCAAIGAVLSLAVTGDAVLAVGAAAASAVAVLLSALALPRALGARHRARRTGALPAFVLRAALAMRVTPTLEAGADAARTPACPLGNSLSRHAPPADTLANAVDPLSPGARRAVSLLTAAGSAEDADALLARAVTTARDAVADAARSYAAGLHGPVTALYAFGVVLPLALVGVLPALPVAGVRVPLPALAVVLDGVLPLALLGALASLLVGRPRTAPPATVPRDHPSLGPPGRVLGFAALGGAAGLALSTLLPDWSAWLLPPAWAAAGALLARYAPARDALAHATGVRDATPDLLVRVGTELAHGAPPETALAAVADGTGTTGEMAASAARVRDRLGVDATAALAGPHGPLAVLPAVQRRTLAALLDAAFDAGPAGGRALLSYANHLDALHGVERDLRADLARLTGTLHQTAAVYAPVIGGVTVALATTLRGTTADLPPPAADFPLVVGAYVLVLAVALPAFGALLADGACRVRVGTSVGYALLAAAPLLPATASVAATLL